MKKFIKENANEIVFTSSGIIFYVLVYSLIYFKILDYITNYNLVIQIILVVVCNILTYVAACGWAFFITFVYKKIADKISDRYQEAKKRNSKALLDEKSYDIQNNKTANVKSNCKRRKKKKKSKKGNHKNAKYYKAKAKRRKKCKRK